MRNWYRIRLVGGISFKAQLSDQDLKDLGKADWSKRQWEYISPIGTSLVSLRHVIMIECCNSEEE